MPPKPDLSRSSRISPRRWLAQITAAVTFYTCLPIPGHWPMNFQSIARYAPLVGLLIGGLLSGLDALLQGLTMPLGTRSALVVATWVALTGGLHLDGAMDTADGLAVPAPERRLAVMADSRSGAFGVMAAVVVLGLKGVALADIGTLRWFALMAAAGWGRWGQVVAIARYPYLKAEGKGAFHKASSHPAVDWVLGLGLLLAVGFGVWLGGRDRWLFVFGTTLGGFALAVIIGAWLNRKLGGHTGDTYGAVVEWTEALLLCLMTVLQ
ncbi:MAG: adenosylcobinamide-GDP ribazoletransferase [Leptolyngbyaceae cyanobacterium T60_A2020_046]|nr:adenosylcobinamide-GDP ribazoletransferase [Leptolyngbyaceae cyanobacterium T60_A2020_046]